MSYIIKVKDTNGNWIGIPALKGVDGITPHIGENGNWFIGGEDTGVAAGGLTELPIASADTLGGVKVGDNLTIDENGVLNADDVDLTPYAQKSELPTKVSDLENDSLFIDNTVNNLTNYYTKTETYTQAEVNSLIGAITTLNIQVVTTLPTENISATTIYLKPIEEKENNNYEEWIYVNSNWELIGTTAIDLTPYATKEYVAEQIDAIPTDGLTVMKATTENPINFDELIESGVYFITHCSDVSGSTINSGVNSVFFYDVLLTVTRVLDDESENAGRVFVYQEAYWQDKHYHREMINPDFEDEWDPWELVPISPSQLTYGTLPEGISCPTPTWDTYLANKKYVDDSVAAIQTQVENKATKHTYAITIPTTGWSETSPYSIEIAAEGILESDKNFPISPVYTIDNMDTIMEEWNKVSLIESQDNKIIIYCKEAIPTVEIPIQITVVR